MQETKFFKENINNADIQNVVREMVVESERKYKVLVENSLVGIAIYSDNRYVYINPRVTEILGYDIEEIKDFPALKVIHPDDRDMAHERITQRLQGEKNDANSQIKLICKDGSTVDVIAKSARLNYNGKSALVINFVDITAVKQAQREIKELSKIIETAQIPIVKLDTEGAILYLNKNAEEFFSADIGFYENKTIKSMLIGIDPEEMQEHIITQTGKGGFDREILCKRSDNTPVKMRLTTSPLVDDKNEMSAIACFLVDPNIQKEENNLLNAD